MSWFSGFDLFDPLPTTFFSTATSICPFKLATTTTTSICPFKPADTSFHLPFSDEALFVEERMLQRKIDYALDFLAPTPQDLAFPYHFPSPGLDLVDVGHVEQWSGIRALASRVAALEVGLGRERDRKYKWTAEVEGEKGGVDRKYKWVATAKAGGERDMKWTEEYKGRKKDEPSRTYTFQVSSALAGGGEKKGEVKKGKKKAEETKVEKNGTRSTRVVEITDPKMDQGAICLRKAFAKRTLSYCHGKKKELSPEDAAMLIQMSFKAHLIRRSQVLRGLRDLAVAKAKLKEIRALFSNFSYRRHVASDAEERQRFSEKIIVLLVTVDAIEGPDYMVRAARRSMVDELEAMLEIIDPQSCGRLGSLRRRKFDLPESSAIQKEMELGVAEVVQLLNQEYNASA